MNEALQLSKLASKLFDTHAAYLTVREEIEDVLDSWWPDVVDRIGHDSYDSSLEIYFESSVDEFDATPEQQAQFWEWGFLRCWLNFHGGCFVGGTERAYVEPAYLAKCKAMRSGPHE